MTVSVPGSLTYSYAGNGSTTAFSYPVKFLENADLVVVLEDEDGEQTVQTITTHYSVSGAGNSGGGTVTMVTAPATGETVHIYRDTAAKQVVDLTDNSRNPAQSVEDQLDRFAMAEQDINNVLGRAWLSKVGEAGGQIASGAAGETLVFDADGNVVPGADQSEIEAAQGYAEASAASATAAAASASAADATLDAVIQRDLGDFADDAAADAYATSEGITKIAGTKYFNTTSDILKRWDGSAWLAFDAASVGKPVLYADSYDQMVTTVGLDAGQFILLDETVWLYNGSGFSPVEGHIKVESFLPGRTHQQAVDAAMGVAEQNPGCEVTVGTDLALDSISIPTRTKFKGRNRPLIDFSGRADLSTRTSPFIGSKGSTSFATTLTADALFMATSITVADASGFSEGDLIEVYSMTEGTGDDIWTDTSVAVQRGELVMVTGANAGTGVVTINEPLRDRSGYLAADIGGVRKVVPVEDVEVSGFRIRGHGRQADGPGDYGVYIVYGKNIKVNDNDLEKCDLRAIEVCGCYIYEVKRNRATTDPQGANGSVNYCIVPSAHSRHGEIKNNVIDRYRHGVVSSHLSSGLGADFVPGIVRIVEIAGNTIARTWHAGISSHSDIEYAHIHHNTLEDCDRGIEARERNMTVEDNYIISNGRPGISIKKYPNAVTVRRNTLVGSFITTDELDDFRDIKNLTIEDNIIKDINGVARVIRVLAPTGVKLINLTVDRNKITDYAGPGGAAAAIEIEGDISGSTDGNKIRGVTGATGIRIEGGVNNFSLSDNDVINVDSISIHVQNTVGANVRVNRNFYAGYVTGLSGSANAAQAIDNFDGGAASV